MIEINLIPDVKRELLRAQRTRAMVISVSIITSIAAGALVVLLLLYILGVQTIRTKLVTDAITSQNTELMKVKDLSELLTIQNQLSKIDTLNDTKKIDSRVFDMIAAVSPVNKNAVQVSNLNIDSADTSITVEGQTSSFESLEVFKKTLDSAVVVYTEGTDQKQTKLASDISVTEVSYGEDAQNVKVVRFKLTFKYATELFSSTVPTIQFKLEVNGNVTDSYLGIPRNLFTERAGDLQE